MPALSSERHLRRRGRRACAAILAAAAVTASTLVAAAAPAIADTRAVDYAVDLSPTGIAAAPWTVTGDVVVTPLVSLAPGGAAWQGIPSTADAATPQPGDLIHGSVDVVLHDDVDADATVLVRATDDRGILAEHTDLTAIERGVRTTVQTVPVPGGAEMHAGASTVYVELHNDTAGTIDFSNVRLWGERNGERIDYVLPNATFADGLDGDTWGHNRAEAGRVAEFAPGSRAERTIAVGSGADAAASGPLAGDLVTLAADAFVGGSAAAPAVAATLSVRADDTDLASTPLTTGARWASVAATASAPVPAGAGSLSVVIDNPGESTLRLRSLALSGVRELRDDDLNGDGTVDDRDRAWFAAAVADGTAPALLDYDGDGEVTRADVDFFARFVLQDRSVVFPNLAHLDFLSEDVELDGQQMMITHLYSEPRRAGDPSSGYEWVGDPQEGVSALDDVARAVIVYAEHHATYGDAHSYRQMVKGLRFAMWMQADNGDFDNFVARDGAGDLVKKHSQSSQTSFGYWATRAWEAYATALPALTPADADLAAAVQGRLDLIRGRVADLLADAPTSGDGRLLGGDVWMSSIAVNAANREYAGADDAAKVELAPLVATLAAGIAAHQSGSFTDYPLGAIQTTEGGWSEWGSVQVEALARASVVTGDRSFLDRARLAAESFLSDLLISGRAYAVSPNKATYPQLNYGTASYVDNFLALYEVTGERVFADAAGLAASWWRGDNPAQTAMFTEESGVAFDAVDHDGVNRNGGAESVVEALRGILRVQRVPTALAAMTAGVGDRVTNQVVEAEDMARAVGGEDVGLTLAGGGLNDPALAVRTQSPSSGVDEQAIYADAQNLDTTQELYRSWSGRKGIFVSGSGHNNVRLFDGGSLETRIGVGGAGEAAPGDSVALRFSAIVQFDTDLDAEVFAVDVSGAETLVSDDAAFSYHPRTWYAGSGAVRTSPVVAVPAGAVALVVRFSVASTKPDPAEGYANVTEASLWRIGTPELRYGASDLSGGAYALQASGSASDWSADIARADDYLVYASVRSLGAAGGPAALAIDGRDVGTIDGGGVDGQVRIVPVGRMTLPAGRTDVRVVTGSEGALGLDALILTPVRTSVALRLADGTERFLVRDAGAGRLLSGTAAEVAPTPKPDPSGSSTVPTDPAGPGGSSGSSGASGASGAGDPAAVSSPTAGSLAGTGGTFDLAVLAPLVLLVLVGAALILGTRRRRRA